MALEKSKAKRSETASTAQATFELFYEGRTLVDIKILAVTKSEFNRLSSILKEATPNG